MLRECMASGDDDDDVDDDDNEEGYNSGCAERSKVGVDNVRLPINRKVNTTFFRQKRQWCCFVELSKRSKG
jgi:hypothetical protein